MNEQTTVAAAKTGQETQGMKRIKTLEGKKFLTFLMANEKYGLEILKVREIIGIMDVTPVPTTPAFVRGVINLRGKVIPVVDLRLKFGMDAKEDTQRTCIIVVHLTRESQEMIMGIIVDEVSEVLDIDQDQIEPPPSFGADIRTDFILGMGKVNQRVVTMLDIDRVLSEREIALVENSAERTKHQPDKSGKSKNPPGKE
ncbi:MAG TPA: chemotaxis protein CheW [Thermodesulfobacteriota bacterium]|nr:chemotaxis protein CheW [Thermodesulfobacteriota bacterium]